MLNSTIISNTCTNIILMSHNSVLAWLVETLSSDTLQLGIFTSVKVVALLQYFQE